MTAPRTGLAQPAIRQVIVPVDTSYIATVSRAQSALALEQWAGAAALWQDALLVNTTVPAHWYALGRALYNDGRDRECIAAFERAMQLDPEYRPEGAGYVARAYTHLGNVRQASRWGGDSARVGRQAGDVECRLRERVTGINKHLAPPSTERATCLLRSSRTTTPAWSFSRS
jgi:tetratricopeptide (TPR) repeat protein